MKVYSVLRSSYCESDDSDVLKVTFSLEEAKEVVKQELETARQDYDGQSDIVFDVSEDGKSFEAYKDGYYAENHIAVSIIEKELTIDGNAFWKDFIKDYLNNSCEGEKFTLLSDDEVEEVVNDTVNKFQEDDAVFNEIYSSIEWDLHHHDIVQEKEKYAEKLHQARRKIEEDYGLEDGETDGLNLREIEKLVHEEEGSLDRYISDVEEDD